MCKGGCCQHVFSFLIGLGIINAASKIWWFQGHFLGFWWTARNHVLHHILSISPNSILCHFTFIHQLFSLLCILQGWPQHGWSAISCLFLDGLWLIHDNYPSSIPLFCIVWDTLRNLTWLNWFYHILRIFLLHPIHYKILGYCWGSCHESTVIHPRASMK